MCAAEARNLLMKLHLAAMAALVITLGATGTVGMAEASAQDGHFTECVPFMVSKYVYHQRCTTYYLDENGNRHVASVYHIDQDGQWYVPNE